MSNNNILNSVSEKSEKNDIEKIIDQMDISFSERLFMFIDQRKMKDSDVYNAAHISKQIFHKIRSHKNYHPKKSTVYAIAIALKLDLSETSELLYYAGYSMVKTEKLDVIVQSFIENKDYDINKINFRLFELDQNLLGCK